MVNLHFAFITDVEALSSDGKPAIMCVPVQGHVSAGIYQNLLIRPQQSQLCSMRWSITIVLGGDYPKLSCFIMKFHDES